MAATTFILYTQYDAYGTFRIWCITCQASLQVVHAGLAVEAGLDVAGLGDLAEVDLDEVAVRLERGGARGGQRAVGRAALPPSKGTSTYYVRREGG